LDMSIRAFYYFLKIVIYKSRNWICLLEIKKGVSSVTSTKVEIGYVY